METAAYTQTDDGEGAATRPEVKGTRRTPTEGLASAGAVRLLHDNCACTSGGRHRAWPAAADRTGPPTLSREGMADEIMNTYHVAYARDESGWWVASVREVHGCHTQGRTV